ncbi:MAG: hypothetical protein R2769_12680 [Saprospiraceae bacterium]
MAGAISIPTRNLHQVIEMAHKSDIKACIDLLNASLLGMDGWNWEWVSSLARWLLAVGCLNKYLGNFFEHL